MSLDYPDVLRAMGMDVLAYKPFGRWSGRWAAIVRHEGTSRIVVDYYGSCSGCDGLEALREKVVYSGDEADFLRKPTVEQLVEFGQQYLHSMFATPQEVDRDEYWDSDDRELADWVKAEWAALGLP